jgi:class 3 adenylate cyclase
VERPKTLYARSGELSIAYQDHGGDGPDLLLNGGVTANVETAWQYPEAVRLFERLGRFARVIRFDRRDQGLSDAIRDNLTLEAHAEDALAVMDAVGSERPIVVGGADGARSLAVLAATRPDRVGGLIAFAPSAASIGAMLPQLQTAIEELRVDPRDGYRGFAMLSQRYAADPVRADRLERGIKSGVTPRQIKRFIEMTLTSNVGAVLPLVQAPTLVLRPAQGLLSAETAREFAGLIPGAEYREIPGEDLLFYTFDPDVFADAVEEFVTGSRPAAVTQRVLATVLFTDLVDSTRRASEAGDSAWAGRLERHLAEARGAVDEHGGETIKTTGDGVLAVFVGPAQAVRCAKRIVADANGRALEVRSGVHTGEVERSADDVAGIAVHLAARIMGVAEAGEVLVSRTVRDLVIGSGLSFAERGEHVFKGIPDRWPVLALA